MLKTAYRLYDLLIIANTTSPSSHISFYIKIKVVLQYIAMTIPTKMDVNKNSNAFITELSVEEGFMQATGFLVKIETIDL